MSYQLLLLLFASTCYYVLIVPTYYYLLGRRPLAYARLWPTETCAGTVHRGRPQTWAGARTRPVRGAQGTLTYWGREKRLLQGAQGKQPL